MDMLSALKVAASGLSAQRTRVNVISSNLANAESTNVDGQGTPYRRKDVVFSATPLYDRFDHALNDVAKQNIASVKVKDIHVDPRPPREVFNPSHPDADPNTGLVKLPNINLISEHVNMMAALRSYEANVTSMKSITNMAQRALEIAT